MAYHYGNLPDFDDPAYSGPTPGEMRAERARAHGRCHRCGGKLDAYPHDPDRCGCWDEETEPDHDA